MRRREFITVLGCAAAWPLASRAQPGDRVRRIGVLMPFDENDPEGKRRVSAFTQALADLGWTDGRNMRVDLRWGGSDAKLEYVRNDVAQPRPLDLSAETGAFRNFRQYSPSFVTNNLRFEAGSRDRQRTRPRCGSRAAVAAHRKGVELVGKT